MIGIWMSGGFFLGFRDLGCQATRCLDSLSETMRAVLQRVTRASVTGRYHPCFSPLAHSPNPWAR